MKRRPILAAVGSAVAVLAGVGLLAATARAVPPAVGQPAPAIDVTSLDGRAVTLADLTKQGPAVVVVLRGWPGYQCPICTKQFAAFRGKASAFAAANVPVLFIYPGPSADLTAHAAEFAGSGAMPAGFTLALDPDYAFTTAWNVRWDKPGETAYPSTFVVDADGKIRLAKISHTHGDREDPSAALAAAVAAKKPTTRPAG